LTNFAILLGGGGGSGAFDDPCRAGEFYMMHSLNKHMIVLGCVSGFIVLSSIAIAAFLTCTTTGRKLLLGHEGYRIQKTRIAGNQMPTTNESEEVDSEFA
jgi:hypothetical protein